MKSPPISSTTQSFEADQVHERLIRSRAVTAAIWGMPAVNFELLYASLVRAGGDWNRLRNYLVRLHRPRAEILNGAWKFPEAVPMLDR